MCVLVHVEGKVAVGPRLLQKGLLGRVVSCRILS